MKAFAAWALLAAAATAGAQEPVPGPRPLEEYRAELVSLAAALEGDEVETARERARALLEERFEHAGEALWPDPTVLEPIARGLAPAQARAQARALRSLAEQLAGGAAAAPLAPDKALLERLAAQDAQAGLKRGGRVDAGLKPLKLSERVERAIESALAWVGRALRAVGDFILKLWPRRRPGAKEGLEVSSVTAALVAIAAAALVLLALRALRAKRGAPVPEHSEEVRGSSRDDDPLSRESDEWESYATELQAKGRLREALRAHYHAVLVSLLRAGLLAHQKGRTNWEYAAQLGPDLSFRPSFIELTRRFDGEWYGGRRTTVEGLAEYAAEARRVLRAARGALAPA